MAKNVFYSFPVDVPAIEGPGFMHREADSPGQAKWLAVGPEHPRRANKGDLPMTQIADFDPQPLSHVGAPWKNLRGGK